MLSFKETLFIVFTPDVDGCACDEHGPMSVLVVADSAPSRPISLIAGLKKYSCGTACIASYFVHSFYSSYYLKLAIFNRQKNIDLQPCKSSKMRKKHDIDTRLNYENVKSYQI